MDQRRWRRYLYVSGTIIGFIGALITMSDNLPFTRPLIDRWPKWSNLNQGLANLQTIDFEIKDGAKAGALIYKETGFKEVLEIIKKNHPIPEGKVVAIILKQSVTFSSGGRSIPVRSPIWVLYYNGTSHLVTFMPTLKEWAKSYRFERILFWGFFFIAVGFGVDIIAKFIEIRKK